MSNLQQTSKIVEKIFSSLLTAKTRENRIKECIKLLHILENNMVLSIKFDYILNNIDDTKIKFILNDLTKESGKDETILKLRVIERK